MGRRQAPQALALSGSNGDVDGTVVVTSAAADQNGGQREQLKQQQQQQQQQQQPHNHNYRGDNQSLSAEPAQPSSSQSPSAESAASKSPRSSPLSIPSSKFAASTKRPQTAGARTAAMPSLAASSTAASDDERQQPRTRSAHDNSIPANPSASAAGSKQGAGSTATPDSTRLRHAYTDGRKPGKTGFFHFSKSSKPLNQFSPTAHQQPDLQSKPQSSGSVVSKRDDKLYLQTSTDRQASTQPSRSDLSLSSAGGEQETNGASTPTSARKTKNKPFGLLTRTKSISQKSNVNSPLESSAPMPNTHLKAGFRSESMALRTAPLGQDRAFRDAMNSTVRNRSEDRAPTKSSTRDLGSGKESYRPPPSSRDNVGSNFFSGLRSSSNKAADIFSKGLFGKGSRSGFGGDKEHTIDDDHYVIKVINLPLVEQTRLTRISKRLETSRDKTEFWMPAFPWRAIDYLNYKGCDVEGLYRVPGSGPQIKRWQRRFDEDYDVNLFEQEDLYDINIVGSMLKAWLRELPDELFPKASQDKVARECAGSETVPQMLIDELSSLPPFNYYLLFAITCHLSLLLAHSDKNKMDFRNLCICFQPCMKIDAFSFKFLVCDWRECWKGCTNEAKYIEEEYRLFDQPPPRALLEPVTSAAGNEQGPLGKANADEDAKNGSSSNSSRQSFHSLGDPTPVAQQKQVPLSASNASFASNNSSISTAMTANSDREIGPGPTPSDLRPLSPIKPLSPIGFGSSDSP